jgi:hypothetical protein
MTGVDGGGRVRSVGVAAPPCSACGAVPLGRRPSTDRCDRAAGPVPVYGRIAVERTRSGAARSGSRPGVHPAVGVDPDRSCPPPAVRR